MSQTDSFIEEVSEEVRRDRLFGYLKRYGWIAALIILALVAGTAWNEVRKASVQTAAQERGDALLNALSLQDPDASRDALVGLDAGLTGRLLAADAQVASGNTDAAVAALLDLSNDTSLAPVYRDLAALKAVLIPDALPMAERDTVLAAISAPGAPFAPLGQEIMAIAQIEAGDVEAGTQSLLALLEGAETTPGQIRRIEQVLAALGVEPGLANETEAATQ